MKVVTFGEIMLRLAPCGNLRFLQENYFQATFGGGEANVAVSLGNYGVEAEFVTKLPDNDIARACIKQLKSFDVVVDNVVYGGDRMGVYYVEKGASMRPSKVIYDRAYSSISMAKKDEFDWEKILENADWFHFTGITPALGDELTETLKQALTVAKKKGITVSCDVNYRKKLWSRLKAKSVMSLLMKYVDVCIANEEDAYDVFGIKATDTDVESGRLNREGYVEVAEKLTKRFGFKKVAITLRESISANDNNWGAMLYSDGKAYFSKTYPIRIVDRVGGGDSFGAGLIYGLNYEEDLPSALEFAVGASALKHTIEGDFNRVSVEEVKSLIKNGGSGRVQR